MVASAHTRTPLRSPLLPFLTSHYFRLPAMAVMATVGAGPSAPTRPPELAVACEGAALSLCAVVCCPCRDYPSNENGAGFIDSAVHTRNLRINENGGRRMAALPRLAPRGPVARDWRPRARWPAAPPGVTRCPYYRTDAVWRASRHISKVSS